MTDRDLRKMNRKELLELLIALEKENGQLKERIHEQDAQIQNRTVMFKNTGTLAEAALAVNDIYARADKAAALYLDNIKRCSEQQKSIYNKIISEAEQKAKEIIDYAESEKQQRIKEADAYWANLSTKLEEFYQSHVELRELLAVPSVKETSEGK